MSDKYKITDEDRPIHQNPVKELIVEHPEDYLFSSARNYADLDSMIDIVLESAQQITYN